MLSVLGRFGLRIQKWLASPGFVRTFEGGFRGFEAGELEFPPGSDASSTRDTWLYCVYGLRR